VRVLCAHRALVPHMCGAAELVCPWQHCVRLQGGAIALGGEGATCPEPTRCGVVGATAMLLPHGWVGGGDGVWLPNISNLASIWRCVVVLRTR
jgi:hypothetical protein